jgi:hypothetical protein
MLCEGLRVVRVRLIGICAGIAALTANNCPTLAAGAPEIAVEAGASEIVFGEKIDYLVDVRNVENPSAPDLAAFRDDFEVTANGDESRNQSSTFIINGRVTQQSSLSHLYRFRLTPRRAGKLTIPAPSVTIDGKIITGRSLLLNVVPPEEQDLVVLEMTADRARVYPTQPFEVILRVLVRPVPEMPDQDPVVPLRRRPPHLDVNWVDLPNGLTGDEKPRWLEKYLSENGAGFTLNEITMRSGSIFDGPRAAVFDLYHGREKRPGLDGRPIDYFVYELKRRVVPEKVGTYLLGPATVKGTFVEKSDGRSYVPRRIVAVAPAISLEVREVPETRPATFCGGIGEYRLIASASPTELRVGDPLTLTLDFERGEGSGSLELISAPDLSTVSELNADFEIVDKHPTGRMDGERKRFGYALRPKRAGVGIPPLAVAVFNPGTETFAEIETRPIPLNVTEASRLDASDLVGSLAASGTTEIKSREQGIFQNIADPSELRDQNVNVALLAEVAAGSWCAAGCLFAIVLAHRRRSGDVQWQRRQNGRRSAERKLADARAELAGGRSLESLRSVRGAVVGLIADMRNIVAEGLTSTEADAALDTAGVQSDLRNEVSRLLAAIESAEYGSASAIDVPQTIAAAERLVPTLARQLERSR